MTLENFITELHNFKQEFSLFELQVLKRFDALEKRPDLRQDIILVNEKLSANNLVFLNHSNQIKDLKAGTDFNSTRIEELEKKNIKVVSSLWPWR